VHKLDATQNDSRTTEVPEALYLARDALDRTMVLLDHVVKVFALADRNLGAMLPIVATVRLSGLKPLQIKTFRVSLRIPSPE
jgi:hypothetical protein